MELIQCLDKVVGKDKYIYRVDFEQDLMQRERDSCFTEIEFSYLEAGFVSYYRQDLLQAGIVEIEVEVYG